VHHFNRRAFKLLILAATFAVTAAAAPGGASAASHRPKPKPTPFSEGIDASHWQGTISWSRVATAG
jgi:GH25 family lysozyme M1 (1,4-beta-N-acetylmuramidase)